MAALGLFADASARKQTNRSGEQMVKATVTGSFYKGPFGSSDFFFEIIISHTEAQNSPVQLVMYFF